MTKTGHWHIATTLSSNGHEITNETGKYKKLLILKRRIGILKKLPKQDEEFVILLYLRSLF